MKTTKKRLIGLLFIAVLQLVFPLIFIAAKEKVIADGKEFLFRIQPVDPYDFFQGRYVSLNVQRLSFTPDSLSQYKRNDIIYAEFEQDSTGAKIKHISSERTANSLKLKLYTNPSQNGKLIFPLPFKRFYLEEYKAKKIESRLAIGAENKNFVHVKIRNGEFVMTDISSNGKSLITGNQVTIPKF